jgi:hypothetical protein
MTADKACHGWTALDPGGYQENGARLDIDIAVESLGM